MLSTYTFFWYRESNRVHPQSQPAWAINVQLPAGTPLADALAAAHAAGLPKGTHRSGCFEVQCDEGIWAQQDGNRIDLSTPRRAAKTTFKTWEQLEAEELAERR